MDVVVVSSRTRLRRQRDFVARNRKWIGAGPEVGELAFVGGRQDGAVRTAVSTEIRELGVGAVTAVAGVRSIWVAVHVSVLLEGARRRERLSARRACVRTNGYFRSLLRRITPHLNKTRVHEDDFLLKKIISNIKNIKHY